MTIIPVILSGGVGARLWPISRELDPKPFMRLADGQSLLQKAFLRAARLPEVAEIFTVTNRELFFKTEDEYRAVNPLSIPITYLLEPFGRDTAPAISIAALQAEAVHGPEAILLVLPADHLIADQPAFERAVGQAIQLAIEGYIVTFGILPKSPETGFGYIEKENQGHLVKRFVEKPSLEKAEEYLASGRFLWNAGMFCCRAGILIEQMQLHARQVLDATRSCLGAARTTRGPQSTQIMLDAATFESAPSISIDYGLIERCRKVAVVSCDIGWSDIGSWSAISGLIQSDENGNGILGDVFLYESNNCYIQSQGRVVAAVGLDNLIIIDTPDAILVVDRNHVQDVKQIVDQLKKKQHDAYKLHRDVHRPWGTYSVLGEGQRFKLKRIAVKPGASLSLQMHHHRSEHWIVVSGMAKVINGDKEFFVNTNESTFIAAGCKHRLENPGVIDLVMIEVQSGDYLGEDDIVRFDDIYGRCFT